MIELVPRGTRVRAVRFSEPMYQALERGLKTQTRRPLTSGNCNLTRGLFKQVDLRSGRPDGLWPVASLRCRIEGENGDRRSVLITPCIQANTALWARRGQSGPGAKRENAAFYLHVESIAPVRLNDISEEDAAAEGVLIFCPPGERTRLEQLDAAYDHQLKSLGKKALARWLNGSIHQEVRARGRTTARDNFALLWDSINGPGSWATNPWVWRYAFRKVHPSAVGS